MHVLLVDDNTSRCANRSRYLAEAGIEVISACEECQAGEAMKTRPVDVVCIDSQFVLNRGHAMGAFIERLKPLVPVVLIADSDFIPCHFEQHVDIVIDRADFDIAGTRLIRQFNGGHASFFERWFDEWTNRASTRGSDEATSHALTKQANPTLA